MWRTYVETYVETYVRLEVARGRRINLQDIGLHIGLHIRLHIGLHIGLHLEILGIHGFFYIFLDFWGIFKIFCQILRFWSK